MLTPWPGPKRPGLAGPGAAQGVGPGDVGAEALQGTVAWSSPAGLTALHPWP